jgi:hypothetical protein
MVATATGNVPAVWPTAIVTLEGTAMLLLLLVSITFAPPGGAIVVSVTVQLEDPGAITVAGEHTRVLGMGIKVRVMVADWAWPPRVAVTVAL